MWLSQTRKDRPGGGRSLVSLSSIAPLPVGFGTLTICCFPIIASLTLEASLLLDAEALRRS